MCVDMCLHVNKGVQNSPCLPGDEDAHVISAVRNGVTELTWIRNLPGYRHRVN